MTLAYALPSKLIVISAAYLLLALPLVFLTTLLILVYASKRFFPSTIIFTTLGFSLVNLCLSLAFWIFAHKPKELVGLFDLLWIVTVVLSPVALVYSLGRNIKRRNTEQCGPENPIPSGTSDADASGVPDSRGL